MTGDMEGKIRFELIDGNPVMMKARLGKQFDCTIGSSDVAGVVSVVMQQQRLGPIVRFERGRIVRQVW